MRSGRPRRSTASSGACRCSNSPPGPTHRPRNCLGFARAFGDPRLQIAGWYCKGDAEVVDRRTLACAIEGLSLIAAASEPKVQQLFASAEQKRVFCAPRTAPRGATTLRRHDWIEGAAAAQAAAQRGGEVNSVW